MLNQPIRIPTQYWCLICEQLPSEKCLWCLVHLTDWWSGLGELQRDKRRNLDTGSTEVGMPPGTSITWSLGFNKSSLVISIPPPSYWDPGAGMYITYDKGIPAKIGLTKISRRTKILVYGKNLTNTRQLLRPIHGPSLQCKACMFNVLSFVRAQFPAKTLKPKKYYYIMLNNVLERMEFFSAYFVLECSNLLASYWQ